MQALWATIDEVREWYWQVRGTQTIHDIVQWSFFRPPEIDLCQGGIFVLNEDRKKVSVALISVGGETGSDPTVMACYTLPEERGRGYGTVVLRAAVSEMLEKGLEPVRVKAITEAGYASFHRLPEELRARCVLVDARDELNEP